MINESQFQPSSYRHSAGEAGPKLNTGYEALTIVDNRTTATGSNALVTARTGSENQPFSMYNAKDEQ